MNLERARSGGLIIGCVVASGMIGFSIAAAGGPALIIGGAAVIGITGLLAAVAYGWCCSVKSSIQRSHELATVIVVETVPKRLVPRIHVYARSLEADDQVKIEP